MKKIIYLFLASFSFNVLAIGLITLPIADVKQIEQRAKKDLQIENLKLEVARLGGSGLHTHNLLFGKMTAADFQKARNYFNFNLPLSSFEPSKNYNLIDFLPPKMQGMVGKSFATSEAIPGTEALGSGENVDADLSMNCWSTAFDILRSKDEPTTTNLYQETNDVEMAKILLDSRYSTSVAIKDLKPNDYVLYLVKNEKKETAIDHVAISIGVGMVFEKTDSNYVPTLDQTDQKQGSVPLKQ